MLGAAGGFVGLTQLKIKRKAPQRDSASDLDQGPGAREHLPDDGGGNPQVLEHWGDFLGGF